MTRRIALWSGPRNVSTALMYSFAQREDTLIVDEPLYGHYLRVSGKDHPGRREVLETMDCDGERVMRTLTRAGVARPVLFMKHMAHHLLELGDEHFLDEFDNVLLIRDPHDMLPSLTIQIPNAELADTGLAQQAALFERLRLRDRTPAVLDARELLGDPRRVLGRLCNDLGLAFDEAMLAWPAGPRPEDGVWAKHWYHAVHRSTGFSRYHRKTDFPDALRPLLAECKPHYETLYAHAIRARPEEPS